MLVCDLKRRLSVVWWLQTRYRLVDADSAIRGHGALNCCALGRGYCNGILRCSGLDWYLALSLVWCALVWLSILQNQNCEVAAASDRLDYYSSFFFELNKQGGLLTWDPKLSTQRIKKWPCAAPCFAAENIPTLPLVLSDGLEKKFVESWSNSTQLPPSRWRRGVQHNTV
jgi:hypothetical protein